MGALHPCCPPRILHWRFGASCQAFTLEKEEGRGVQDEGKEHLQEKGKHRRQLHAAAPGMGATGRQNAPLICF